MRRLWLIFAQAVTISVAGLFVLSTLKPGWLRESAPAAVVAILEAPAGNGNPTPAAGAGLPLPAGASSIATTAAGADSRSQPGLRVLSTNSAARLIVTAWAKMSHRRRIMVDSKGG